MDRKVAEMVQAYAAAGDFLEAERRQKLANMTREESRTIFEELYVLWSQSGREAGGFWEALNRLKLDHLTEQRRIFEQLAHRGGWL